MRSWGAEALRQLRRPKRALLHRLEHHFAVGDGCRTARIGVHEPGEQCAVERSPVHSDPHRLLVGHRDLDHAAEVLVVLIADADVARIDAVLVERLGAFRVFGEELVPVVVEVAHHRRGDPLVREPAPDLRHRRSRGAGVDGDPHDLRAGLGEELHLGRGGGRILGVRVRHRLHDHRLRAAHPHSADVASHTPAAA